MTAQNKVMVGSALGNRFWVEEELGSGHNWKIFKGRDKVEHQDVAVKVSNKMSSKSNLENEYQTLMELKGYYGFPKVFELGTHGSDCYLVMQLLERPLVKIKQRENQQGQQVSMVDMLLVVDQLFTRLEDLHGLGIVHGNIKPETLMMGTVKYKGTKGAVYLTDFGLATKYKNNEISNMNHLSSYGGALQYMSVRAHDGHLKTPRDDLESLAYVLAFFLRRKNLPWKDEKEATLVKSMKNAITGKELFPESPKVFATFYDIIKSLKSDEQPDHEVYRKMFRKFGRKLTIRYDYDWPFWSI